MAIVVFGGAFDPFHIGHAKMIEAVLVYPEISQIWLLPTHIPVHKSPPFFSPQERLAMLRDILPTLPNRSQHPVRYHVCELEVNKTTPSWTYETLEKLNEQGHKPLWFLMGSDSFFNFHTWKKPDHILTLAQLIVARRDTQSDAIYHRYIQTHFPHQASRFTVLNNPVVPLSSHAIREAMVNGTLQQDNVPKPVWDAIERKQNGR